MAPTVPAAPARESALPLLGRFAGKRVVVFGDLVADHYVYGQTDRVSREAPVLVVRYEASEVKLGGAANAAANLRALGSKVTVVGLLGRDSMGEALQREFKKAGVDLAVHSAEGLETETKMRILAGGLNTTRQQMLRVDRGNRLPLPAEVNTQLAGRLRDAVRNADAVLVSDYGAGAANEATVSVLRELVSQGNVPVCVDSRYALRDFTGLTVCKPNEPELETLTGLRIRTEADLLTAGTQALSVLRCRTLLVTRGHSGMAVFQEDAPPVLIPVYGNSEAVDVTGAGDTVIASFTLALSAGASAVEAAQVANVAGALVVQKQGTATVSQSELRAELERA